MGEPGPGGGREGLLRTDELGSGGHRRFKKVLGGKTPATQGCTHPPAAAGGRREEVSAGAPGAGSRAEGRRVGTARAGARFPETEQQRLTTPTAPNSLEKRGCKRPLTCLPTCRREKRAAPGCSTREPQRWHSTAFRFRPSADTNSFSCPSSSIAATATTPSATAAQALSSHCVGAPRQRRGASALSLRLCAQASVCPRWGLLRKRPPSRSNPSGKVSAGL